MDNLIDSMGNVTDTMITRLQSVLILSVGLLLLGTVPSMAQLTQENNGPSNADEDGSTDVITQSELEYTTASGDADDVIYEITSQPAVSEGTLFLDGTALSVGDTFSQQDINDDLLTYEFTPGEEPESDGFNYEVSDGNDSQETGFVISIDNLAPTPADDQFDTDESQTTFSVSAANGVLANDSDPGQDDIEVARFDLDESAGFDTNAGGTDTSGDTDDSGDASNVELEVNPDGSFTVTLNGRDDDSEGTLDFKYQLADDAGGTARGDVTINIDNLAPTASDDANAVQSNSTLSVGANGLLSNDSDPRVSGVVANDDLLDGTGVVAVNGASGNVGSTITLSSGADLTVDADGSYSYDPDGFVGEDTFTYTAEDGEGATDQATVTITSYQAGIYVDADFSGSSSAPQGTPPNPYTSLQNAVDNADSDGATIFIAGTTYNEDILLDTDAGEYDDLTFAGWNGESGSSLATTGPNVTDPDDVVTVNAQIGGDITVGDVTETDDGVDPVDLTLAEGFTLSAPTNSVVTLASEGTGPGNFSRILGAGDVLVGTSSGEVNIGVDEDIDDTSPVETTLKGRIQDLRIDKSGGTVTFERFSSRNNPNLGAIMQVGDTDEDNQSRFEVVAGNVEVQQNVEIAFNGDTGTNSTPADPFPVFNIGDTPSNDSEAVVSGPGTVNFNIVGENRFETDGTGTLGTLVSQTSAPDFTTDSDREGNVLTYTTVGNGGDNRVSDDFLRLEAETVRGNLTATGSETEVNAPSLTGVTSDLNVLSGAGVVTGSGSNAGNLAIGSSSPGTPNLRVAGGQVDSVDLEINNPETTVGGVADIDGADTNVEFNSSPTTFNSAFNLADATADFNGEGDFQAVNFGSTLNFNANSGARTSTVAGTFTSSGGVVNLEGAASGGGVHSLNFEGDVDLENGSTLDFDMGDLNDGETAIGFTGSDKQVIEDVGDNGGTIEGVERMEVDNADSPVALELEGATLSVLDRLVLADGNFVTNGGLDMSATTDGDNNSFKPTLVRVSTSQDETGRLADGTGNLAYTGVDADPVRIEYQGSSNMATGAELLPASQDEADRSVEELALNFAGDPLESPDGDAAVLTLGIDYSYSVEDRLEILKGSLAFSDQSSLELGNQSTFVRGDGELITEDVTDPNLGLVRPEVSTVGIDGFNITYVNELLDPLTTGVAFNKANEDQVLDLTVENDAAANLADLSGLENGNLGDDVHLNRGYFRVNSDVTVESGSVFDFNAQELEVNTPQNSDIVDTSFEVTNDGVIVGVDESAEDESLLEFIGEGEIDVIGDVFRSEFDDPEVFVFPSTEVNKTDEGADGPRRVLFQMADADEDQADGFEFDGDFTMTAAANWSPTSLDGVEFAHTGDNNSVDKIIVNGDFTQSGGSLLAFDAPGLNDSESDVDEDSEFTVRGDFTKDAAESSRFYVGGTQVDTRGSVANFTVGTEGEENTLYQANGTFYVTVQDSFKVNGDVENESPDKWDFDPGLEGEGFESEAFEVAGQLNDFSSPDVTAAEITGSVIQDTTGTPRGDNPDTDEIENAGTFLIEGFIDDPDNDQPEGTVSVAGDFTNASGISEIADATTASVGGAVTVESDSMSVNLGSDENSVSENVPGGEQVFEASSLTVDASDGSGGAAAKSFHDPDAVFETSTRTEGVAAPSGLSDEPANPEPGAFDESDTFDYVEISGATDVQSSGQLYLEGYELKQGGNFTLLGFGDRPWADDQAEDLQYTEDESGLLGLVRFVNDGDVPQTVTTDESPSTYFHGLAVNATGDVELASDVATNEAAGGQGDVSPSVGSSGTASGTLRPFGTLFLESGNLFTRDNQITILAPEPTDGEDLVEAASADETRDGSPVEASPVLGGSNTTKVVGTMRRALAEQNEDTGGVVTDGYIYPLGKAGQENRPRYRGLVLELPTDETEPQFFTVENIDNPNEQLPDGGITTVDANSAEGTIQLNEQSLPYYTIEAEDNPNFNSFNVRAISDIGGVSFVNQVRLIQRNGPQQDGPGIGQGDWMQAGGSGAYDPNRGSVIDDDEQETSGGPNAKVSGFTNVIHEGVDLRGENGTTDKSATIALATNDEINPDFGQNATPEFVTTPSEALSLNVGDSETAAFEASDPDGDPVSYSVLSNPLPGGDVSIDDTGTLTVAPDSGDASESGNASGTIYTVDVEAEDEQGLTATASVDVEVGLTDGDANSSGSVNSADASRALNAFLEKATPPLSVAQEEAADVTGNGIGPDDAAEILQIGLNGSSAVASKQVSNAPGSAVVIGDVDRSDGTLNLPVELSGDAENVRSVTVEIDLSGASQKVEDVSTTLPSGWIADHKSFSDGTLKIGMAGTSALSEGEIAQIRLQGDEPGDETSGTFRLNGSNAQELDVQVSPESFALNGNYPNPFSTSTTISYDLKEAAAVSIEVYDVLGRKVGTLVNKEQSAGSYEITLNKGSGIGAELSSGVYVYRIQAGDFTASEKMTVVK